MWRYVVSAAVCSVLLAAAGAGGAGGAGEDWCGVVCVCGGGGRRCWKGDVGCDEIKWVDCPSLVPRELKRQKQR